MSSDQADKGQLPVATDGKMALNGPPPADAEALTPGTSQEETPAGPTPTQQMPASDVEQQPASDSDSDGPEVGEEILPVLLTEIADAESTGSLTGSGSASKITTPLPEAGGPPRPPLAEGATVAERYQVAIFLGSSGETNLYRVADQHGYKRCWACGSTSSMPGDIYCVECGAQLAGRHYRLQEFRLPLASRPEVEGATDSGTHSDGSNGEDGFLPQLPVPQVLLENRVPGVAHVYDAWYDLELGRGYIAWEEAGGRLMASWLPGMTTSSLLLPGQSGHLAVPKEPEEEQALGWMAQAGELLAHLHAEGLGGCVLELANLLVQPGDRLLLLDPSSCQTLEGLDEDSKEALRLSDVRALAGQLEQWYMAVRREPVPHESDGSLKGPFAQSGDGAAQADDGLMVAAYEATGPLGGDANPAVVLAKAREGSYPTADAFAQVLRDLYEAGKPLSDLKLWSGRSSDIGMVRKINEDSVLTMEAIVLEHEGNLPVGLYVVADGMGGHQSGEVASSIAARTVGSMVNSSLIGPLVSGDPVARDPNTCAALLSQAVLEANRRISDLARERHSDLGTTTVAALLVGNQLTVANVGDSRAYLIRDGVITVLTKDHSLVMQLVLAGQISPEDIYTHPRRNEIYRALGDSRLTDAEVDLYRYRLRPGDALLLCSDGLWDFVRDSEIVSVASEEADDPQTIANILVDRANGHGGEDNISVILVRLLQSSP